MTVATILLTKGNLNNNHFYLTNCLSRLPSASIGEKSETQQTTLKLKFRPASGEEVMTDINDTKNTFRKRGWVGKMFKVSEEKISDAVQIEKISESVFDGRVVTGGAK